MGARFLPGGFKITSLEQQSQNRNFEEIRDRFRDFGHAHVFHFWDGLNAAGQQRLLDQAAGVDLEALASAHAGNTRSDGARSVELAPPPVERTAAHGGDPEAAKRARERGEQALADGRVAALVVAGGQATRLGFAGPKGAHPLGPITARTLFEQHAQKIQGLRHRYGRPLPWYIMTSNATDAATRDLFAAAEYFGLPADDVIFFQQEMVQGLDFEGRLLLERPDWIFENPNGHGGSLTALLSTGALDNMEQRGIDTVFYYQVDNPLIRIADPEYVGFHLEADAEMSCKVIPKQDPNEKVGVVAQVDGQIGIVEYTEIDDEQCFATNADGELKFWAGNAAIHVFSTAFIRRVANRADELLPYHASDKKIPTIDKSGNPVQPNEPNGRKLERFVFDALSAAQRVCVVEGERAIDYSPIKNAEGEDSPATAREDLIDLYRSWLDAANIQFPQGAIAIEVDHSRIDSPEEACRLGIQRYEEAGNLIRVAAEVDA